MGDSESAVCLSQTLPIRRRHCDVVDLITQSASSPVDVVVPPFVSPFCSMMLPWLCCGSVGWPHEGSLLGVSSWFFCPLSYLVLWCGVTSDPTTLIFGKTGHATQLPVSALPTRAQFSLYLYFVPPVMFRGASSYPLCQSGLGFGYEVHTQDSALFFSMRANGSYSVIQNNTVRHQEMH